MSTFDREAGEKFAGSHYDEVRGYIREKVIQANLRSFAGFYGVKTAVDVGGGDGRDALWLAQQDIVTSLIEPLPRMIERARKRFKQSRVTVTIVRGDDAVLEGRDEVDLVLSHGVLLYQDDPVGHLKRLRSVLAPGGLLSLATKGKVGAFNAARKVGDQQNITSLEADGSYTNKLGKTAIAYTSDELEILLGQTKFQIEDWFGVRVQTDEDTRLVNNVDPAELTQLVEREVALGHNTDQRENGQFLQMIARAVD